METTAEKQLFDSGLSVPDDYPGTPLEYLEELRELDEAAKRYEIIEKGAGRVSVTSNIGTVPFWA